MTSVYEHIADGAPDADRRRPLGPATRRRRRRSPGAPRARLGSRPPAGRRPRHRAADVRRALRARSSSGAPRASRSPSSPGIASSGGSTSKSRATSSSPGPKPSSSSKRSASAAPARATCGRSSTSAPAAAASRSRWRASSRARPCHRDRHLRRGARGRGAERRTASGRSTGHVRPRRPARPGSGPVDLIVSNPPYVPSSVELSPGHRRGSSRRSRSIPASDGLDARAELVASARSRSPRAGSSWWSSASGRTSRSQSSRSKPAGRT